MRTILGTLVVCALALAAVGDLSGKWTGTISPDGEGEQHSAMLNLKHNGGELTGTAGPDEQQQFAIANGKVDGDHITFEVTPPEHPAMKFDLRASEEDHLTGDVTMEHEGQTRHAKLDVKRAKE